MCLYICQAICAEAFCPKKGRSSFTYVPFMYYSVLNNVNVINDYIRAHSAEMSQ